MEKFVGLVVHIDTSRHIPNKVCTESSSSSRYENSSSIDSSIYKILSMQSDMKVLAYPTKIRNEWDMYIKTSSEKHEGVEYNGSFDVIDEYLGSLGVTNGIC